MPTVNIHATEVYYEIRGAGPPVLLIMGASGDGGQFDAFAEQLADELTRGTGRRYRHAVERARHRPRSGVPSPRANAGPDQNTQTFRSSSGRCVLSLHPAEDLPQVLITAPSRSKT